MSELERKLSEPGVWSDPAVGERLSRERSRVEGDLNLARALHEREQEVRTLIDWVQEGEEVGDDLKKHLDLLEAEIEAAELKKLLGEFGIRHRSSDRLVALGPVRSRRS